jgi:hypothetical protein
MKTLAMIKLVITALIVASLAVPARASQPLTASAEAAAFQQLAATLPLGSRVDVQTRAGRRLTATLMHVTSDAIIVKRESRVPEPAVSIPFAELTRLRRHEKSGFSLAKAVGVGLAAGVGAILTVFAIAVSLDD